MFPAVPRAWRPSSQRGAVLAPRVHGLPDLTPLPLAWAGNPGTTPRSSPLQQLSLLWAPPKLTQGLTPSYHLLTASLVPATSAALRL